MHEYHAFCEQEAFVDELTTIDFKFSVIFMQESWSAETDLPISNPIKRI